MGLSSKQVSSDRHGWSQALLQSNTLELPKLPSMKRQSSQQQQQQVEQLKCPRCESTNTKFCYYNNYNKSQPRHFCKACKRHWTKGGTLRNVPVGGGRKNKRLKSSNSGAKPASKTTTTTTTNTTTTNENLKRLIQSHQQQPQPPPRFSLPLGASASLLGGYDEKNSFSDAFYQALVRQPPTSLTDNSIIFNNSKALNDANNGIFLGAAISLPHHTSTNSNSINDQDHLQFPYSNLGSFDNNPCSISSSNFYNLNGDQATVMEDSLMNNTSLELSSSSLSDHHQPWTTTTTTPATAAAATTTTTTTTNSMIDISSNWGWDDFDKFVSVDADLTMPWDDTEIKPPGS